MKTFALSSLYAWLVFAASSCQNIPSSEEKGEQENQVEFENSDGNTVVQVNLKIESIETNAPITNGNIVLVVDGKTIEESLNEKGIASLSVNKSLENKDAKLIVRDSAGHEQYRQDFVIKETAHQPEKISIRPFKRFVVDEITGKIAAGAANEHTFRAKPNHPLLVQVKSDENLYFGIQILNSLAEVIVREGNIGPSTAFRDIPFSVPREDTYTIEVAGNRNEGSYTIHVVYVDNKDDAVDSKTELAEGQQHYDRVGKGSYDSYLFEGTPNNTVIIQYKSKDNLSSNVQVFNSIGERLLNETVNQSETYHNIPFTPEGAGEYEIRVLGSRGFGLYDIRYYRLEAPAHEQLEFGEMISATLGQGAFHEYQFAGTRGKAVKIKTMGLADLSYYVQVYNPIGEQLLKKGPYSRSEKYYDDIFTPEQDGNYSVRILGNRNYGEYKMLLDEL